MFRPSVLLLALVLSGSTLWSAFMDGSISVTSALIRFLIAVPVAALMVHVLSLVTASYQPRAKPSARSAQVVESEQ
ncbi:MAG TPA: hypothetical protein VFD94_12465 [Jatrophihabitans sp.]|nr:hypothetical protein [Jatrophihabitans sp.]